jgi:hypothetical protein
MSRSTFASSRPASSGCRAPSDEYGQQRQDGHLDDHQVAGSPVIAAVELDVEGPVDPRDRDHGEDDCELGDPADGHMLGEVMGRLSEDGDVDEIVEELDEADAAVWPDLATWPRRAPKPALEASATFLGHGVSVAISRMRQMASSPRSHARRAARHDLEFSLEG